MADKRPNVVWLMADQHAAAFAGCYGHPIVQTPFIDRLASRGALFENAYTTCPMCIPARFAMLTGLYGNRTGTLSNEPLSHRFPTAAHRLRQAGYATAFIGKLHPAAPQPHGFDYYIDFPQYLDYLGPKAEIFIKNMGACDTGCGYPYIHTWYQQDNDVVAQYEKKTAQYPGVEALEEPDHFEAFVARNGDTFIRQSAGDNEPFFLFASFLKPHFPQIAPPAYRALYRTEEMPLPDTLFESLPPPLAASAANPPGATARTPEQLTDYERKYGRCADLHTAAGQAMAKARMREYFASVTYMDDCVGRILRSLEETGQIENTLIVYTADHGEMLFDHGLVQKFVFYDRSVRIPLIVSFGDRIRPQRVTSLADLTDLLPTTLSFCGLDGGETMDGVDQAPLLCGEISHRPKRYVFSELGTQRAMCFDGRFKLCAYEDGVFQLFDRQQDPGETANLAGEPACADLLEDRKRRLFAWKAGGTGGD